jgi:hypothetical protein
MLFALAICAATSSRALAQDDSTGEVEKLKAKIQSLQDENAQLRAKLSDSVSKEDTAPENSLEGKPASGSDVTTKNRTLGFSTFGPSAQIEGLEAQLHRLEVQNQLERRLSGDQAMQLQVEYEKHMQMRKAVMSSMSGLHTPMFEGAIQARARRIAEAQIENQLRMREAQAKVQVLQEKLEDLVPPPGTAIGDAIEKADELLSRRQEEYDALSKKLRNVKEEVQRDEIRPLLERAKAELREAQAMKDQAMRQLVGLGRTFLEQLTESAIDLAVAQSVAEGLQRDIAEMNHRFDLLENLNQSQGLGRKLQDRIQELQWSELEADAEFARNKARIELQIEELKKITGSVKPRK